MRCAEKQERINLRRYSLRAAKENFASFDLILPKHGDRSHPILAAVCVARGIFFTGEYIRNFIPLRRGRP